MSTLLPHVELATGPDPKGTVIWMHGLGADGWDFVPIVRELPLPEELALRFIFPHAPVRPVTINGGMAMRAWYDIAMTDIANWPSSNPRGCGAKNAGMRTSRATTATTSPSRVARLTAGTPGGRRDPGPTAGRCGAGS